MAMKLSSAELDLDRQRLPPIDLTPRTFLEQPQSFTRPGSRVSPLPPTVREERPHRSLKKVARGHREWSRGLCECTDDKRECKWKDTMRGSRLFRQEGSRSLTIILQSFLVRVKSVNFGHQVNSASDLVCSIF